MQRACSSPSFPPSLPPSLRPSVRPSPALGQAINEACAGLGGAQRQLVEAGGGAGRGALCPPGQNCRRRQSTPGERASHPASGSSGSCLCPATVCVFDQQPAAAESCAVSGGHGRSNGLHVSAYPDTASSASPHAHTFLQCAEYEHALKTGKSAHMPLQPSAPLAVSKLANRENLPSRALAHKGVPKTAAARRSQPQLQPPRSSGSKIELEGRSNSSHAAKKGGEPEKECRGAGGAASGGADHLARTVLQQAAARPTAVKARSASMRKSVTALCGSANGEHSDMDLEEAEGKTLVRGGEGALHSMIGKADLLAALARGVGGAASTHARAARTSVEKDLMRISAADLLVAITAVMGSAPGGGSDGEGATASA